MRMSILALSPKKISSLFLLWNFRCTSPKEIFLIKFPSLFAWRLPTHEAEVCRFKRGPIYQCYWAARAVEYGVHNIFSSIGFQANPLGESFEHFQFSWCIWDIKPLFGFPCFAQHALSASFFLSGLVSRYSILQTHRILVASDVGEYPLSWHPSKALGAAAPSGRRTSQRHFQRTGIVSSLAQFHTWS